MGYLDWHYFLMWPKIMIIGRNLALFPFYFFGVSHHLRTLFYPWKRQIFVTKPGFHLDDIFSVIIINIFSRIIGAFMRLFTIFCGLSLMIFCALIGLVMSVLWVFLPGITLIFFLKREVPSGQLAQRLLTQSKNNLNTLMFGLFKQKEGMFLLGRLGFDWQNLYLYFQNQNKEESKQGFDSIVKTDGNPPTVASLLEKMADVYTPFKNLLERENLTVIEVRDVCAWYDRLKKCSPKPLLSDLELIKTIPEIGFEWAYGYTLLLNQYSQELTRKRVAFPILIGRDREIATLCKILTKSERNNCLVAGEPGVARHRIVETFAYNIAAGNCPKNLSHKRVVQMDMHAILAKSSLREAKELFSQILSEAQAAGNIIIVIDEIDKYLSSYDGATDLSDVLSKFAESSIGIIGITTPYAYHKYIETNSTLSPLFEKIEIQQPDLPTILAELEISIVGVLEKKYNSVILYQTLKKVVEDADRFISTTPFPAKAIELLDESCLLASSSKHKIVTPSFAEEVLTQKFHMPLGQLQKGEKEKLANLEELLHQRIINQTAAIRSIASSIRRARLDISSTKKPIGSFLFLGPTGVGKTETAKALASIFFGGEDFLARFDMSQYQKEEGLERLIGSVRLGTAGELTSKLTDRPYGLLLFDEVEKSEEEIENLLLTLLDEGYITNSRGSKINAKNTIIIATSNAGAEYIREAINMDISDDVLKKALIDHILSQKIFSPEFINRFDAVIVFTSLSEGHLREVAKLMLIDLNKRLSSKNISVGITDELVKKLAAKGFDPQFGARAMRRIITENIEDQVAKRLLTGNVKKGEIINIDL